MMKKLLTIGLALCVVGLAAAAALRLLGDQVSGPEQNPDVISGQSELSEVRGFTVSPGAQGDLLTGAEMTREAMEAELDALTEYAVGAGFNAVFFRVREGDTAFYRSKVLPVSPAITADDGLFSKFDPLDELCSRAEKAGLRVYAILDIFPKGISPEDAAGTAAGAARELAGYDIHGLVFDSLDGADAAEMQAAVESAAAAARETRARLTVGMAFDGEDGAVTPQLVQALTEGSTVDLVLPRIENEVDAEEAPYFDTLSRWIAAVYGEAELYSLNNVNRLYGEEAYTNEDELGLQLYINTMTTGVNGSVLEDYTALRQDREETRLLASFLSAQARVNPLEEHPLEIPQTLAITYPEDGFSTTSSSVFVMGTSDPGLPLEIGGERYERASAGGVFGIKTDLVLGSNTVTVRQGDQTRTITIRRTSPSSAGVSTITGITQSSLFPQTPLGVDANETITFTCVAPSGGRVTASLDGKTLELTQVAAAQQGVPATFRGELTLSPADYPADETVSLGKTTYTLTYGGLVTTYYSQGETYVAGANVRLALRINSAIAGVLSDPEDEDSIIGTLNRGAEAYVYGRELVSGTLLYKLADGGYVSGANIEIVEGRPPAHTVVPVLETELTDVGETIRLTDGTTPAVLADWSGDTLVLTLFDTEVTAPPEQLVSGLLELSKITQTTYATRLTFTVKEGVSLWGYNIENGEDGVLLWLKRAPVRSDDFSRPLKGITVMLDPGHGGYDMGALGAAYLTGPDEADINLAVALATRHRLEQLGATVVMTRTDDLTEDTKLTIYDRREMADALKPDLFLSIHHNSAPLTGDLNKADWMEAYYHEASAAAFAEKLMEILPETLGRKGSAAARDRYYVTRMTYSPAVLLELGYIVNPAQYEDCCDTISIFKSACSISRAILDMIPQADTEQQAAEGSGQNG